MSTTDETEKTMVVYQHYKHFLEAGGQFDWQDWQEMGADERAAMMTANQEIWQERASMIAEAMLGGITLAIQEATAQMASKQAIEQGIELMQKKRGKT